MTIDQINEIRSLITKRDDVKKELEKLSDISAVTFTLAYTGGNQRYYERSDSNYFSYKLDTEIVGACQEAAQTVMKNKIEELTAQLKELGLEE